MQQQQSHADMQYSANDNSTCNKTNANANTCQSTRPKGKHTFRSNVQCQTMQQVPITTANTNNGHSSVNVICLKRTCALGRLLATF